MSLRPRLRPRPRRFEIAALALLLLGGFWVESLSLAGAGEPRRFNDTGVYEELARLSVLEPAFWAGDKPPTAALAFKLAGIDGERIGRLQSVLSVLCWFVFGLCLAGGVRSLAGRLGLVTLALAMSFTVPVNQWDRVLLSESLSLSLTVLTVGLAVALARVAFGSDRDSAASAPSEGRGMRTLLLVAATVVSGFLLALTRDTNVFLVAFLALGILLLAVVGRARASAIPSDRKGWMPLLAAALGLLLVTFLGHELMVRSERWRDPLTNVLLSRVVPNPEVYRVFVEKLGLPENRTFARYRKRKAWSRVHFGEPIRTRFLTGDPEVADVHHWMRESGRAAYARYLLVMRPRASLLQSFAALRAGASRSTWRQFGKGAGQKDWTLALTRWFMPSLPARPAPLIIAFGVACLTGLAVPRVRVLAVVAAFLLAAAWIQAFLSFHGDDSNLARHAAPAALAESVGLVLLGVALLAWAGTRLQRSIRGLSRRTPRSRPESG